MPTVKAEQAAIIKTIGQRLKQAREMCNLSQSAAAERMGYANGSKLSKIEGATDTNSIPLWLIARAAKYYEVSIDFLFGASEDWETDARMTMERETSAWLFEKMQTARLRDMDALRKLHDRLEMLSFAVQSANAHAEKLEEAFALFKKLNPQYDDDLLGGAKLQNTIEKSIEAARAAQTKLKRYKLECKLASSNPNQKGLFDD